MLTDAHLDRIVDALRQGVECGDRSYLDAVYASGARTWHSYDGLWVDAHENLQQLDQFRRMFRDVTLEVVHRARTSDVAIIEYVMRATNCESGSPLESRGCIVAECDANGLIHTTREYTGT